MSVVRQQADSFTVKEFVHGFMAPNLPVAIQGVTEDWPCRLDWLHADGSINIQAMESSLGDAAVCVTHTSEPPDGKAEDCPDTSEMTFRQYAGWWRDHTGQRNKGGCSSAGSLATLVSDTPPSVPLSPPLLYMKDFHLNSACPHYKAYHTPPYFQDDWLNEYHDATAAPTHPLPFPTLPEVHSLCSDSDVMVPPVFMTSSQQSAGAPLNSTPALQPAVSLSPVVHAHHQGADPECVGGCTVPASSEAVPDAVATSDYRFLYLGVAGTRTPLHADVFRSFSWSVNVSGRKRWSLLPPQHTHLLYDKFARTMAPHMDVERFSADQHERFANVAAARALAIPYTQEAGEALFVPSGWYHTVENLCDTLSINHNWFNGHNLTWVTDYLLSEHAAATAAIEDCRPLCNSHEEFESLVQRNLAANVGMDLPGVSRLLHHIQHRAEAELAEFGMALQAHDTLTGHSTSTESPSVQALSILFLASAIPFIVFGFLDNSIMLVAGEEIDARLGVNLGITMLASAGLGNTLADVIGVGVSTSIEAAVRKLPFLRDSPKLSQHQLASRSAKVVKTLGACSGVALGCVLGLAPLLVSGHFWQPL
ncbi:MAG: hypothetical protein WDW36_006279 [Sanguina aurantia]